MLTPSFELKQDDSRVIFFIRAPYTKISETEIFAEGNEFRFFSKPYFLRLILPGNIFEGSASSAEYDADKGTFTITLCKETPGEHFEDLDMLTKLLAPSEKPKQTQPSIEVIDLDVKLLRGVLIGAASFKLGRSMSGSPLEPIQDTQLSGEDSGENTGEDLEESEPEFDWQIEQEPFKEESILLGDVKYGFANQKSGIFKRLQCELTDVIDLPDAEVTPPSERTRLCEEEENLKFDEDYYLADLYSDESVQDVLSYTPQWQMEYEQWKQDKTRDDVLTLTDDEKDQLRRLPGRQYLIDEKTLYGVFLGLVDIIYAYAYDHRVTEGESNVESNWTISKISSSLSWLEVHGSLHDTVRRSMRRSLCYPLHRHWQLARKVLQDTQQIFSLGKKRLLKCLLDIHGIFAHSDPKYILNDVFITDYCVWIQSASSCEIRLLAEALEQINISKEDLGLGLVELEAAAAGALNEEDENSTELTGKLAAMTIKCDHHSNQSHGTSPYSSEKELTKTHSEEVCEKCGQQVTESAPLELDSDDYTDSSEESDGEEDEDSDSDSEDHDDDDEEEDEDDDVGSEEGENDLSEDNDEDIRENEDDDDDNDDNDVHQCHSADDDNINCSHVRSENVQPSAEDVEENVPKKQFCSVQSNDDFL